MSMETLISRHTDDPLHKYMNVGKNYTNNFIIIIPADIRPTAEYMPLFNTRGRGP